MHKKMQDGYTYVFTDKPDPELWFNSDDDDWDIEVYKTTGDESWKGKKKIDDTVCEVFYCPDGKVRATKNTRNN